MAHAGMIGRNAGSWRILGAMLACAVCVPAPAQEGEAPEPPGPRQPEFGEERVTLTPTSEPMELRVLVEYVAEALQVNITVSDQLQGTVMINAPHSIRRDELLGFLDSLLETANHTIVRERPGMYRVIPIANVPMGVGEEFATTRIIPTPGVRPTALQETLVNQIGATPGGAARLAFLDELGVVIVTDTPRRVAALERLIEEILLRKEQQMFTRFELEHIAASAARERIAALIGEPPPPSPELAVVAPRAETLHNVGDRLAIDAQGNALIFRGTAREAEQVRTLLVLLDVPNLLPAMRYFGGMFALQIAHIAQQQGLGPYQEVEPAAPATTPTFPGFQQQPRAAAAPGAPVGGAKMIVDRSTGWILYYGTPAQHAQLEQLVASFDTTQDEIVIQVYKLLNADAESVADLIMGMIEQQARGETAPLLQQPAFFGLPQQQQQQRRQLQGPGQAGEGIGFGTGENVFVLADTANNQVLVKAPQRQQGDFARLIDRIDLRRAQVYLEAQIVSVTSTDDFRLAFETQLINAGGTGGVVNTNFGLGIVPTGGGDIRTPKAVGLGLGGLTAALIKSDQVPIIINALRRDSDTRILSSPQILVDDNEEAQIVSLEEQPVSSISQVAGAPQVTSFGGFESAGTTLLVTPRISDGDYLGLAYEIELSNFQGEGAAGLPGIRQTNRVSSGSTTVPGGYTIVIGGIKVDSRTKTVAKVPLLGDIPLIGLLFRDTSKSNRNTTLYVFITPRILREGAYEDLLLLTLGPQAEVGLDVDLPRLTPQRIEVVEPRWEPEEGEEGGGGAEARPEEEAGTVRRRVAPGG